MSHPGKPTNVDALIMWPFALLATIILAFVLFGTSSESEGATFRQRAVSCAPAVHHQAVVAAAIPYPVVGYQVSQHLQQQAVDEHGFRSSPSQQRLTYLEGYYEATQRFTDSAAGSSSPPQDAPGHPAQPGEGPNTPPTPPQAFSAPQPPAAPSGAEQQPAAPQRYLESTGEPLMPGTHETFADVSPMVAANCAGCHASDESKGGFGIAAVVTQAKAEGDCETILALVDSIATGSMPKGKPMSDADRLQTITELLTK